MNPSSNSFGLKTYSLQDSPSVPKDEKRRGHKTNKQLIKEIEEMLINSGRIAPLMDLFTPHSHLP
jgi:hypothetical protein